MFDKGLFGGMFDFNGDGKMDSFEKAAEFSFFMEMMSETYIVCKHILSRMV